MKQVLLVLVLVLGGLKANACTVTLGPTGYMATSRMSLCEAWDRYYMATYQMKAKGIAHSTSRWKLDGAALHQHA